MKKTLFALGLAALMGASAAETDISKTWAFNQWNGYKPFPKVENKDGVVTVKDVKSKHGFGMKSSKTFAAKAGDKVTLTAMAKGKGVMFFQLQNTTGAKGLQWTGVAAARATAPVTADWKKVSLTVTVDDTGKKPTTFVIPTFGNISGTELAVKETKINVVPAKK